MEILSNLKVRNLGPGLHRDGGGLVLVVDAGGSRNWGFVYREPHTKDKFGNGKRTKLGLGGYPTVSLQQARAKAAEARGYLNETPPRSPKEVWKERRNASNTPTFSEMSDVYLATMTKGWRSDRHREQVRSNLLKHCAPIADMPVNEITTENVLLTIHTYAEQAPVAALKLRGTIEQVLAMVRAKGHIDRNTLNPATGVAISTSYCPRPRSRPIIRQCTTTSFRASCRGFARRGWIARAGSTSWPTRSRSSSTAAAGAVRSGWPNGASSIWTVGGGRSRPSE